ncbi:Calcipressin [Phycomyces nitens]|nr:Calcipressin [Phycomyces nitens]
MADNTSVQSIATNTLLIPDIPKNFFACSSAMKQIEEKFAEFGPVSQFILMKGFGRIMVIYEETMAAINAKQAIDRAILFWEQDNENITIIAMGKDLEPIWNANGLEIRIYFGQHNPINPDLALSRLQVPDLERNFLISPPGSPFEDWEQTLESPPNRAVLASDLSHALADHSDDNMEDLEDFILDDSDFFTVQEKLPLIQIDEGRSQAPTPSTPNSAGSRRSNGQKLMVVLSEDPEGTEELPRITIQDWDGDESSFKSGLFAGVPKTQMPKLKVEPTARPPLQTR